MAHPGSQSPTGCGKGVCPGAAHWSFQPPYCAGKLGTLGRARRERGRRAGRTGGRRWKGEVAKASAGQERLQTTSQDASCLSWFPILFSGIGINTRDTKLRRLSRETVKVESPSFLPQPSVVTKLTHSDKRQNCNKFHYRCNWLLFVIPECGSLHSTKQNESCSREWQNTGFCKRGAKKH